MQQRRLRLGDILDDYCARERRVTNHAVVALVDDEVKQTRCTTCDTEHEYKQGKMPTLRRKKDVVSAAYKDVLAAVTGEATPPSAAAPPPSRDETPATGAQAQTQAPAPDGAARASGTEPPESTDNHEAPEGAAREDGEGPEGEVGRVHRRLIRATLPRPENHAVERPIPEFTMRQPTDRGGRFRGGAARGAGSRPGGAGRGAGSPGGHARGPVFGRPPGNRGGGPGARPSSGRQDVHRPPRGGQPGRHGKKHSK